MFTSDQTPDLDPNISMALERAVEDLRAEFSSQLKEAKNEIQELKTQLQFPTAVAEPVRRRYEGLESSPDDLSALHYVVTQIDSSRTQAEILEATLAGSGRFASRAAIFVEKENAVQGWGSYGFAPEVQELSQATLEFDSFPLFTELHGGDGSILMTADDSSQLCAAVGADAAEEGILIPIVLSDNIVGALYADRLAGSDSFNVLALQLLTHASAQAIEALPERTRHSTATLYIGSAVAVVEEDRGEDEVEESSDPAALETEEAAVPAPEPQQIDDTAEDVIEVEDSTEAEPEPAPEVDIAGSDEHLLDEVSDSLYVDSSEEAIDLDLDEQVESSELSEASEPLEPFGEAEETEAADDIDAQEPLAASAEEEAPEPVVAEDVDEDFESTGEAVEPLADADEEEDADITPSFENDVSSAEYATETEVADSYSESQDESDGSDEEASSEEAVAEFAEETIYSEPSAPEAAESLEESIPVELKSEPTELSDSAAADRPSDLYVEDYSSAADGADSTDSSDSLDAAEEASLSGPALQEDQLQSTGEPSKIFSQTAGIPHIPAQEPASTPDAPPSGAEIAAPSDLDGPGWAFTATAPSGTSPEDASREEAKRLARLLITEIKLYNEEEVEEGRQSHDLTRRLGEEIERSRQIYDNRIEESIRSEADYFQEELVNILAGGEAEAL